MSKVPLGTHTVDQLYLFAATTKSAVSYYLRTGIAKIGNPTSEEIMASWQQAQEKMRDLAEAEQGLADTIVVTDLDPADHPALKQLAQSESLAKSFFATSIKFAMVEVDRLVAPQRHVNLEHVEKIQSRVANDADLDQLIEVCLSPKSVIEPIQHMEAGPNFHIFSSKNDDLRFLGAFYKDETTKEDMRYAETGGIPAASVLAFVGYGAPEVNAYHINNRYILNNGFHRVYALRQMGFKKIPMLIKEIHNVSLELPSSILGVTSNYLVNHPRPALIKDFFEPGLAFKFKVPQKIKTLKVKVITELHDIPV